MFAHTPPCNQHPENASVGAAFLLKCLLCTSYHPLKASRIKSTTVFLFAFFGDYVVRRALFLPFSFSKEKEKESNEKRMV